MGDILFLSHRIPYPPNRGDKIRSWHFLRHLARDNRVHLVTFAPEPGEEKYAKVISSLCGGQVLVQPITKKQRFYRALQALLHKQSVSIMINHDPVVADFVRDIIRRHPIDRIVAFSGQVAHYAIPYVSSDRRGLIDLVDVDSEKWRAYADKAANNLRRWFYAREAKHVLAEEKRATRHFHYTTLISKEESDLFRKRTGSWAGRIKVISNGVDTDFFTPEARVEDPRLDVTSPMLLFTGVMDYPPNVDGVLWFVKHVWPGVRARYPQACFYIVGNRPNKAVRALARQPGIIVTGYVVDTRPYFHACDLVVTPLKIARGVQNKVLEAMAMGCPVVATSQANLGIDAQPGRDLMLADSAEDMMKTIAGLIDAPEQAQAMGAAARQCVMKNHSWHAQLKILDELLDHDIPLPPLGIDEEE